MLIQKFFSGANHIKVNDADHHMIYKQPLAVIKPILDVVQNWRDQPTA